MEKEDLSRRTVLRGALVVGCGLWLPIVLSGCNSKKAASPSSEAPGGAPPNTASSAGAAAPAKVPQANVQYQTQPKNDQKCSTCVNFISESNTCKLVEGQISPEGWCSLWTKKG
jgi:hypothetical protein